MLCDASSSHTARRESKACTSPAPALLSVVVPPAGGGGRWPSGPDASSRSIRAHRPWPYHPPWTPAGKGSEGWVHRATEAALPNPGEGSERPVRDNKRGDQWPSGRNRAVRRSLPVETPTQPRLPPASPCNPAGTSQQNKHISTPHPEPLSEHVTRAVWRRGMQGTRPHFNHANTLVPNPLLGQR